MTGHGRVVVLLGVLALGCRAEETYTSTGSVVAINEAGARVTLSHDDIPGLMPAMTMAFPARSGALLAGVTVGTRVRFEVAHAGAALVVTRLEPIGVPGTARPGVHDHTPHHSGVVTMVGMRHLETVALRDGRIRVYLSDVWRRPLPVADASGTVTLGLANERRVLPLVPRDEALEATGPPLAIDHVPARVHVARADEVLEANYVLPIASDLPGAAGVPSEGCVPPPGEPTPGIRGPRCVIGFGQPVTAVVATPAGDVAVVAVAATGVTAWRMPAAEFLLGFEPAPAVATPTGGPPHADVVNAMAPGPDGGETVVAIENRLLVHSTRTGRLVRELPPLPGAIRSIDWAGDDLLVSLFYDRAAHLLDAGDGRELHRIEVEREGAGVAVSPDARLAAVGSELGPIAVFDLRRDGPPELLTESGRSAAALAFVGPRLLAANTDGLVRTWELASRAVIARGQAAVGLTRLAVAPGGRLVASAGLDHAIRLHEVATGALVETLGWHRAAVWGLAWAGPVLVSGDGDGQLAVWDLVDRVGNE
jgi:Cu/Ag efflux protein CusF